VVVVAWGHGGAVNVRVVVGEGEEGDEEAIVIFLRWRWKR
jgi:hypothetical protein